MKQTAKRTRAELAALYTRHVKTVYRVCYAYMKNAYDTEDAVHDTFMKLLASNKTFESTEHEKAWLIRTATNNCKNALRHWRRRVESLDDHLMTASCEDPPPDETMSEVCKLPDKYKTVVLLYYYEGYSSKEISAVLGKPISTITNYMSQARKLLRKALGGEFNEYAF